MRPISQRRTVRFLRLSSGLWFPAHFDERRRSSGGCGNPAAPSETNGVGPRRSRTSSLPAAGAIRAFAARGRSLLSDVIFPRLVFDQVVEDDLHYNVFDRWERGRSGSLETEASMRRDRTVKPADARWTSASFTIPSLRPPLCSWKRETSADETASASGIGPHLQNLIVNPRVSVNGSKMTRVRYFQ